MTKKRLLTLKDRGFHPDKILDIGAHLGNMALELKQIWPYTEILCLEANPYAEEELKKKKLNYKIVALSDTVGVERDFWVSTEWLQSSGNSLYRENTPSYSDGKCKTIKVVTDTLDNLFQSGEQFDFIKLDTQGSEVDILRGGIKLIQNTKYILTETAVHEYNLGGNTIEQMFEFMTKNGFALDDIGDFYHNDRNVLMQLDLLFKRKE